LLSLLKHPSIASKNWVYRQYDHTVRAGTAVLPGSDAAVFLVREANKILAATSDCNGLYCALDPRQGARIAIAEAARNLACSGAVPLAVTDNLNFGNPHKPENFWQLRECVEGLAEGCNAFGVPVTGGNVSLYNESPAGAIDPTPTVGMVGLIEDEKHITTSYFKAAGDAILLLGGLGGELGATHYLKVVRGAKAGPVPKLDFAKERALHDGLRALIKSHLVKSAHDLSEGGLGVALAESILAHPNPPTKPLGATVELGDTGLRLDQLLFNETQGRIVISAKPTDVGAILLLLEVRGIAARRIGTVGGNQLKINADGASLSWSIPELHTAWYDSIANAMKG
jgi:phosphoribosylformylglycinamidine synthase